MAHDEEIGVHGVEREGRINQRFALFDRACAHRHVHHICAEALACKLERRLCAGRVFKEHIDLGQACQRIGVFVCRAIERNIFVGQIKNRSDVGLGERLDP